MDYEEIIKKLESLKNPKNVLGMARFGIRPKTKIYGISIPELRKIAKTIGKNHKLALRLWNSKVHEARILAGFIAEAEKLTESETEKWVKSFDSWDVCDQVCSAVLDKTEFASKKVVEYSKRKEEFVKRTAFTLITCLAVHNKKMKDEDFIKFFPLIKEGSNDERNFVKKAVNWALRQIGKRNKKLNKEALNLAKKIQKINSKSAKWIAGDAIRELTSQSVQKRLKSFK
jgi:3-methyladenine DNA glycosylase AlkD